MPLLRARSIFVPDFCVKIFFIFQAKIVYIYEGRINTYSQGEKNEGKNNDKP